MFFGLGPLSCWWMRVEGNELGGMSSKGGGGSGGEGVSEIRQLNIPT